MWSEREHTYLTSPAAVSAVFLAVFFLSMPVPTAANVPHTPILINGNSGFTPANGVVGGSGTQSDPYLIEGWDINASTANGIDIRNTDAHFVVRNVFVYSGGSSYEGVHFLNVTHGAIESSLFANNVYGIHLFNSRDVRLSTNVMTNDSVVLEGTLPTHFGSHNFSSDNLINGRPLRYYANYNGLDVDGVMVGQLIVANCTDFRVTNLQVSGAEIGAQLAFADRALIAGISVSDNAYAGIRVLYTRNSTFRENTVIRNRPGFLVGFSSNLSLLDNTFANNSDGITVGASSSIGVRGNILLTGQGNGIYIQGSGAVDVTWNQVSNHSAASGIVFQSSWNGTVMNNWVKDNGFGIALALSSGIRVWHNVVGGNVLFQGGDNRGPENAWDDGYPSGGNWWSDYAGVDTCSGPLQNICPAPDGIGDTPYVLDADSQDNYPLMAPPDLLPPFAPTLTDATLVGPDAADLTLQWNASPDEGTANGTVAYRVLRATDWTGPYAEVVSLPANGSPSYQDTCLGCGHSLVDTATYFFKVRAVDAANNTAGSNLAAKYAKPVAAGKNLLTVPVQVSDVAATTVLQTVWPDLAGAWTYESSDAMDPWKARGAVKGGGDLTQLPIGTAFWLDTAAAGVYTVAGLVVDNPVAQLQPGWNLVAYASVVSGTRDVSLAGVSGVTRFQTFDALPPYRLRSVPANEPLVWGEAYWVYTTDGGLWAQG